LRVIGDRAAISSEVRSAIQAAEAELSTCTGLQLTLAISYGARNEMVRAAIQFAKNCLKQEASPEDLNETEFSKYLDTSILGDLSDVDLVIRTSGERRLSNFMLWQAAYAELVFLDCPWPEFSGQHLREAAATFTLRQRRFGGAGSVEKSNGLFQGVAK
jgi:undecaprenyl diphosphate synthase